MHHIMASHPITGGIDWHVGRDDGHPGSEEGVRIALPLFSSRHQYQRRQALKAVEKMTLENNFQWLTPGPKEWKIDCDGLRAKFPSLSVLKWLTGTVSVEPEFETKEKQLFDKPSYDATIAFYLTPSTMVAMNDATIAPIEITESLGRLRLDHPDERKVAFIMMKFGTTPAHAAILQAIRGVLKERGISGLRADERQYHDDLFPNVMTYMHGCAFGIAVFERLEANDFNPNVSLEVGYMMASRKAVCLLKDKTLPTLHTDLVGKIYRTFDPQTPTATIPEQLRQWMDDHGIV